jgi:hypothetical protein
MPEHPLTVNVCAPGSVIVTLCVCAEPVNVSDTGKSDTGPDAIPLTTTENDVECPLSSVIVIVALPFWTADTVKVALPCEPLVTFACSAREAAEL